MSPFPETKEPVWIPSKQLQRPSRAKLRKKDIEKFLDWLFSDVARKPAPMRLREATSVAKYLQALAREGELSSERRMLDYLTNVVWRTALRTVPVELSSKKETIAFLERHAGTYLPERVVERAIQLVRDRGIPSNVFEPPRLASRGMSIEGASVAGLQDDLSERIYAAYWALRQAKIHGARRLVFEVLNAKGLKRASRRDFASEWDSDTVYERVKQFEERLIPAEGRTEKARKKTRTVFARKWVDTFRYRQQRGEA